MNNKECVYCRKIRSLIRDSPNADKLVAHLEDLHSIKDAKVREQDNDE